MSIHTEYSARSGHLETGPHLTRVAALSDFSEHWPEVTPEVFARQVTAWERTTKTMTKART